MPHFHGGGGGDAVGDCIGLGAGVALGACLAASRFSNETPPPAPQKLILPSALPEEPAPRYASVRHGTRAQNRIAMGQSEKGSVKVMEEKAGKDHRKQARKHRHCGNSKRS